jgi:glutamate racemase
MIGIFDSGVGGLSVLRALRAFMLEADVVYFGDVKNAPYGIKTQAELSELTANAIALLQREGAERIISACNSVSASLALSLFETLSLAPQSLIEMVGPTVAHFKGSTAKLALCATPATIKSNIYQNAFRMLGRKDVQFIEIPDLAGAIEFGQSEHEIENIIQNAFTEIEAFDTLILSCTHYPLVKEVFERVLGPEVTIFDPSYVVAERAKETFSDSAHGSGSTRFLISAESEQFRKLAGRFFPADTYTIEVLE